MENQLKAMKITRGDLNISAKYCSDLVRRNDKSVITWSTMFPRDKRVPMIVLKAFEYELDSIPDHTSSPEMAMIRYHWWRRTVALMLSDDKSTSSQPVCRILHPIAKKFELSSAWFNKALATREHAIDSPPSTVVELENYAEGCSASSLYLMLELCGVRDANADHAASHIGKSSGLLHIVRQIPIKAALGKSVLPESFLDGQGIDKKALLRGESSEKLEEAVFSICCVAKAHLDHSRTLKDIPREALPVLSRSFFIQRFLNLLEKRNFNVFHPSIVEDHIFRYLWWDQLSASVRSSLLRRF